MRGDGWEPAGERDATGQPEVNDAFNALVGLDDELLDAGLVREP
jgi:hypothetical protein